MFLNLELLGFRTNTDPARADTPIILPVGGAFSTVNIICTTPLATIYYTIDGSTPTAASTEYTGTIVMEGDATIKAICIKAGLIDSAIALNNFIFGPTIDPPDGECWVTDMDLNYVTDALGEFISTPC